MINDINQYENLGLRFAIENFIALGVYLRTLYITVQIYYNIFSVYFKYIYNLIKS